MIAIKSIQIEKFKGINDLTCHFDDLTVLVGLNNTGKTSILQAIYLLIHQIPYISEQDLFHSTRPDNKWVDLRGSIAKLGLPGFQWLLQHDSAPLKITGTFENGCIVSIQMAGRGQFYYTVSSDDQEMVDVEKLRILLRNLRSFAAEFFRPPGIVSAKETMLSGEAYRQQVSEGKGNQYWRNSIWWGIQSGGGAVKFEPVRKLIQQHFPNVDLHQPRLDENGNPSPILIEYTESGQNPLDIAQSGAGLHTFLSLAQLIRQSKANIILLDEPDSHLHSSQQAIVIDLLTEISQNEDKQVILATHSPDLITRVSQDSIRWIERGKPNAEGGLDAADLLESLGVSAGIYLSLTDFPEIIVYVEGKEDKPILEKLIQWCRNKVNSSRLPTTKVIRHKDGKFTANALQGISRTVSELNLSSKIVGIRDLDWEYGDYEVLPPSKEPIEKSGPGYILITLPCKELENTFYNPLFVFESLGGKVPIEKIEAIVSEEATGSNLVKDLRNYAMNQIRERYPQHYEPHTKEEQADTDFQNLWVKDPEVCIRLVSGKKLRGRIRERLRTEHGVGWNPKFGFDQITVLPEIWAKVATRIFPDFADEIVS